MEDQMRRVTLRGLDLEVAAVETERHLEWKKRKKTFY